LGKVVKKVISAINLKQFQVVFSKEVDATTAQNEANYVFGGAALADGTTAGQTPKQAKAVLQADKKTVVVTLADALSQQEAKTLTVRDVKTADGVAVPQFAGNLTFFDATIPTAVSATVVGPNKIEVVFSELVNGTSLSNGAFSIDGGLYALGSAPVVNGNVVTITTAANLPAGNHTVTVNPTSKQATNVLDYAGFEVVKQDVAFTYAVDTTAPVATVKSVSQTQLVLEFNEQVQLTGSGLLDTDFTVYHTYNGTPAYKGTALLGTDNKTLTVNFASPVPVGTATFFLNNSVVTSSKQLTDLWGNAYTTGSLQGTVTTDVTAPAVSKVEVINNTTIDVTFSEAVEGVTASDFVVKDTANNQVLVNSAINTTGNTYRLTVPTLNGGQYSLAIAEGALTDTSLGKNKLAAYSTVLTVNDTVPPTVVDKDTVTGGTQVLRISDKKVKIQFSEVMDTNSVLDKNVYLYNGLPLGSTDTVEIADGGKSVILTFAASVNSSYDITLGRVKDAAGNYITQFSNVLDIKDFTNVTASAIEVVGKNAVKLTFDGVISAATAYDFQYKIGTGSFVTPTGINVSYAADGSKTYITLQTADITDTTATGTGLVTVQTVTALGAAGAAAGAKNEYSIPVEVSATAAVDKYAPKILTVVTGDSATANNKVDKVTVTFSENLYVASVQESDFTVEGYTVASVEVSNATVVLHLTEKSTVDTGATPKVTLVGSVEDSARNVASALAAVTATDAVAPIVSSYTRVNATTVDVTFSEALDEATAEAAAYTVSTAASADAETLTSATLQADGKTVRLVFSAVIASGDTVVVPTTVKDSALNTVAATTITLAN
jgi:trimeric autotransporter adhesin